MIVIGYQGIGKSTLSKASKNFIDLESGNFWVDGVRASDWYKAYCQIAEDLSRQGYIVFTSSHKEVREWFINNRREKVVTCFPVEELKDEWIKKLSDRYSSSKLEKDYKALMNAKDRYIENITEIRNDGLKMSGIIPITDTKYDLSEMIYDEYDLCPADN